MIRWDQVVAGYVGKPVLQDVKLRVEKGQITGLIGPNGCGKTTLLKTAAGLLALQRGEIFLGDRLISDIGRKEVARKIAYLPQHREVPEMSVEMLVSHGRYPYLGWNKQLRDKDKEAVERALFQTGLTQARHREIKHLSGGERQKAYLAMMLAQETDWLLMDEPTTFLDIRYQLEILDMMKAWRDDGKGVLSVFHDLDQAFRFCDTIVLMQNGRIVCTGTPEKVFESGQIGEVFGVDVLCVEDKGRKIYHFQRKKAAQC